jgi:cytosine/adenosine deaminase-related metal-dependent hydrolase
MQRTVIRNGFVVSMDAEIGDLPEADVLVEDGVIVAVAAGIEVGEAEEIDASGTVVLPGFVDAHRHAWQGALRGILPDCSLDEYLAVVLGPLGGSFRPEDVHIGNLLSAFDAFNAGITTMLDWSHINHSPEHADAAIGALQSAGIRAVYAHGTPGGTEWWGYSALTHPDDVRRVRERYFNSGDGLLTLAMAIRATGHATPEAVTSDFGLARELGIPLTVHAGFRVTGYPFTHVLDLQGLGLLGPDVNYVHCTTMTDEELQLVADSGGSVTVTPLVEMNMAHGAPPIGRCIARGLRPSLGIDVATSAPTDMFTQMRTAMAQSRSLECPEDIDSPFVPTLGVRDVLELATIEGARTLGLEQIGSLAPGKHADITLIRVDQINTMPLTNPVAAVVAAADTSNVDTVLVQGRIVKRNGRLVDFDRAKLLHEAERSRDFLLDAAELTPDWLARRAEASAF